MRLTINLLNMTKQTCNIIEHLFDRRLMYGVMYVYKTVNSKTELFTNLTNQSSCDEARAMGCLLKSEKWNMIPGVVNGRKSDLCYFYSFYNNLKVTSLMLNHQKLQTTSQNKNEKPSISSSIVQTLS